jgi:rhamnose utilization protein RhaD (predicted bifunctional aldolase and dehydrogenase)
MTGSRRKLGHYSDDAEALEFVGSAKFEELAALGTSCPDHFLRTKIAPLTLDPARLQDDAYLAEKISDYRDFYAAYYERCKRANSPPCAIPTRSSCWCPALAASPSPPTRPPRVWPASSMAMPST